MSAENHELKVYQTTTFEKTLKKLDNQLRDQIEDQVDLIIDDPLIGKQKRGDLSHMRVHKFDLDGSEILLGYNWNEGRLTLTLLNIGPHENFYRDAKKRRKADMKIIT